MRVALPVMTPRAAPAMARVSLTDRCDMACVYCRPSHRDGYLPADERLDVAQWERLARALVAEGVRRVRITGGEPLLHRDVVDIARRIKSAGVTDLALTTNASRLAALAAPLREAGVDRVTVSLDSLVPETFARVTRGGDLSAVLAGVDAALAAGFTEVKTNTVVLRGENDGELSSIARWAWDRGITPRFIEVMGVGEGARVWREKLVTVREMRRALGELLRDDDGARDAERGPARYVAARDGSDRRAGFITGMTDTYCAGCDRLRVTSDGVLRPCLATNDGVSVVDAIEAGGDAVRERLDEAWAMKPDATWKGCTEVTARAVNMRATGG
ncbi:MAG: GTP 3',8-cyclase MoaA [Polyangiales bacterium]